MQIYIKSYSFNFLCWRRGDTTHSRLKILILFGFVEATNLEALRGKEEKEIAGVGEIFVVFYVHMTLTCLIFSELSTESSWKHFTGEN